MSEKITIAPDEIWDYFKENKSILKSKMHLVAENKEFGIEIYLTEHNQSPQIVVEADKFSVLEANCSTQNDCESKVKEIYDKYLTEEVFEILYSDTGEPDEKLQAEIDQEAEIETHEDELDTAIEFMLDAFVGGEGVVSCYDTSSEIISDLKEIIGAYLYLKWGIEPYRPMVIEYEDGTEEYDDYPYSKLSLEEYENNPIFKQQKEITP